MIKSVKVVKSLTLFAFVVVVILEGPTQIKKKIKEFLLFSLRKIVKK